ncbi:AI-2E family transporter [Paracoccus jiaweipingae]|uniref:AI-2E family transporter n=1 Tax=unclassified Paracoccus (in: a-proteobacteria) TaxID=2688777 RepID=UPI0037B6EF75
MRISPAKQAWWWGGAGIVLLVALWGLGAVLMPFIMGAAIAYFLDPVADRLERLGLSRILAVAVITLVVVVLFVLAMLWLVPTVIRQGSQLIENAPGMIDQLQGFAQRQFPGLMPEGGTIRTALSSLGTKISESGGQIMSTVAGSLGSFVGVMVNLVLIPVIAFYLLLDWDRMVAHVDELLPREHAPTIRRVARDIDKALSGFVRGQGTVILILAVFYSGGLLAVGLPYAVLIGCLAATLSFIPYVGALIGGVSSIGIAAFTFWDDPVWIGAVAAIFLLGQAMEGNILTPNLVGGSVNLHPVWLILALSVFGTLFGFVGMLVAVPVSAALGVLVRFFIAQYKESPLYTGRAVPPPPPQPTLVELVPRGTLQAERAQAQQVHNRVVAQMHSAQDGPDAGDGGPQTTGG